MKKLAILLFAAVAAPIALNAQKIGYIDSDIILNKMPEYKSAQKQLDDLAAEWQTKADALQAEVDKMYADYKAEEVLLTQEQKKQREEAIVNKEKELFSYREAKFGATGELFKKREELIKPIQDKLFEAVQKVAKNEGLGFIFDKAGGIMMLYADPKYDKTFEVMEELGIPNDQQPKDPNTTQD